MTDVFDAIDDAVSVADVERAAEDDRSQIYCGIHGDQDSADLVDYSEKNVGRSDWKCHACKASGTDVVAYVAERDKLSMGEAASKIADDHGLDVDISSSDTQVNKQKRKVRNCQEHVVSEAEDKRDSTWRHYSEETLEDLRIGWYDEELHSQLRERYGDILSDAGVHGMMTGDGDGTWMIPHLNRRGRPELMTCRDPEPEDGPKYIQAGTSGAEHVDNDIYFATGQRSDTLVLTEGYPDAIAAYDEGFDVIAAGCGSWQGNLDRVAEYASRYDTVLVVSDNDDTGRENRREIGDRITSLQGDDAPKVLSHAWDDDKPEGYDLDEWCSSNKGELEQLIEDADRHLLRRMRWSEEPETEFDKPERRREVLKIILSWDSDKKNSVIEQWSSTHDVNKGDLRESLQKAEEEHQEEPPQSTDSDEDDKQTENQSVQADYKETDEQITRELSVPNTDEVIRLNPRPPVVVNELSETAFKTQINDVGTVDKEPKFKVYSVQFGKGANEDTSTLLVEPNRVINKGEEKLPVKTADLTKDLYKDSDYLKQKYREIKRNSEDYSKSYEEFLETRQEVASYLELQDRIDVRSKEVIEDLSNDTILSLIQEYLRKSYRTDPKLRTVMYPKIVQHDKSQVRPDEVGMYAPHTQMWTNTKVGKSHTSDRVGRRYEDATPAGLLGYADSDGKQRGMIDGLDTAVFIDEFDFGSSSEQLNDHLLSLMEQGRFEQVKAGRSIKTRFYGSMTYMANPKEADMPADDEGAVSAYTGERSQFELVSKFEQLIQVLGMNIQAMASRFGVIVFDDDMQTAEPMDDKNLSNERFRKLESFFEWAQREIAGEYTDIEHELEDWLEQEYEDDYCERVRDLAEDTHNEKVEKFWKNHLHSHRHARGQALRMAVYQHAGDVVKHDYSIDDIREEADKQWEQVKSINMDSLENMTKATDNQMMQDRARSKIDGCNPKYLRLFMKSVIKHHQNQSSDQIGRLFTFDTLKDVFEDIRRELPDSDVNDDSRYWKWSRIRSRMSDNINRKRMEVEQQFGVELMVRDSQDMFRVKVPERFKAFLELEIGDSGDTGGTDESGDTCDTGDMEDSSDTGDTSDVGFTEPDELKIEGDYEPTQSGVKQLFRDNQHKYDGGIPEKDLTKYFGRKYDGGRQNQLTVTLSNLESEGTLTDCSDGFQLGESQ